MIHTTDKIIRVLLLFFTVGVLRDVVFSDDTAKQLKNYDYEMARLKAELDSLGRSYPDTETYKRERTFRSKAGGFVINRLKIPEGMYYFDPRFFNLEYDKSYPECEYYLIEGDRHLGLGDAVGPYFDGIERIVKVLSKVGMYEIAMMVDSTGFVSKAEIIKDTFKDNEAHSLVLEAFSSMYFHPDFNNVPTKVVVRVVALWDNSK